MLKSEKIKLLYEFLYEGLDSTAISVTLNKDGTISIDADASLSCVLEVKEINIYEGDDY